MILPSRSDVRSKKVKQGRLDIERLAGAVNMRSLKRGLKRITHPVLSEMDGWVLSYEVKSKKPAPAIYRAALDLAGAGPGETVFKDDLEENTAAAASCGIRGLTFRGADVLEMELTELGLIDRG